MKIVTAAQMREMEQRADASGNTFANMMERAGTLTAQAIVARWNVQAKRVLVLVGPGNNGGDGLVCARALHERGAVVSLYVWRRVPTADDLNWERCLQLNLPVTRVEDDPDFSRLRAALAQSDLVVDALLGTGVTRPIEGSLKDLLNVLGEERKRARRASLSLVSAAAPTHRSEPHYRAQLIAIDLPTGLNPDTGALDDAAVAADMTVTFAFPKIGQFLFPGADAVGELVVADIGIPAEWAEESTLDLMTSAQASALLPKRERNSNKGTYGKAMLACGSMNYTGAPTLAAHAAGRAGAGLVTLAVPQTIHAMVAAKIDEATFLPLPDRAGSWRPRAANELLAQLWDMPYDALLVGCGLGRAEGSGDFLRRLLEGLPQLDKAPALVLDADALNLLAEMPDWWTLLPAGAPAILTPHPGEMSRLLGASTSDVQADRIATAREASMNWNAVVVLKGAFTVVAAPDGRTALLPFATPAMATAGTGDVLAGTIVGLLAQYHAASRHADQTEPLENAYTAALVGAFIHGLAGTLAGREIGDAGVVAGDLLPRLPQAMKMIRDTAA